MIVEPSIYTPTKINRNVGTCEDKVDILKIGRLLKRSDVTDGIPEMEEPNVKGIDVIVAIPMTSGIYVIVAIAMTSGINVVIVTPLVILSYVWIGPPIMDDLLEPKIIGGLLKNEKTLPM